MIERILGIDLGIASLGWAVIEYDKENDANNKIVDCGVRLFTAAETPKEKESPNKARREARGIRRVIKRRRIRMNEIKKLCIAHKLLGQDDIDLENGIFNASKKENPKASRIDVWELRHDALSRKLIGEEFARILIHIAKHRGYKFNGDDEADEESGKVKKAGMELRTKFETAGCRSVGEWLWNERRHHGRKRNKSGDYEISIHRDFLVSEIDTIFAEQNRLGNPSATEELKEAYKNIAFYVRPMQSIEHMVGSCTYFPDQKRAPKSSPTAERFVALGKFFSTVVVDNEGNEKKIIELKSIDELMSFATSKEKIDYKQLRKFLVLGENQIFKGLAYKGKPKKSKKGEDAETQEWEFDKADAEKKVWINLKGHAALKAALGDERFSHLLGDIDAADEIAKVLTYYKDERQKREELAKLSLDAQSIEALCKIGFTDFVQLSFKALKAILPEMENGKRYDEAVALLGKPAFEKSIFLPPLKDTDIDILNPTVIRAFAQFRKVANALVKKYDGFDKVHFELAREVNTKEDRKRWEKDRDKNEKIHRQISEQLAEHEIKQNYKNVLKLKLRSEQKDTCPYCQQNLNYPAIFEDRYAEIDHILPLSRSQDDSYVNKVLVHSKCNQDKKNQTPYEWLSVDEKRWNAFKLFVLSESSLGKRKKHYLLKENFGDLQSQNEFISRNINDTRYMSKAIKDYCKDFWQLNSNDGERIQVRSGKLTSALRHQWGLDSKNRDTHTHHAADAIMIAFSTPSMVQKLSNYYRDKEIQREKEKPIFKAPIEHLREAVEKALTLERNEKIITKDGRVIELHRLLISRPPRASVTGAAHKETIQSPSDYRGRGVSINDGKGMCDNGDMPRVDVFTKDGKYYLVPIYVADFAKEELPNITAYGEELPENVNFIFTIYKDEIVGITTKATANKPAKEVKGYFVQLIGPSVLLNSFDNGEVEFFRYDNAKKKYVCQLNILNALAVKKYTIDPLGYYHEVKHETRLGTIPQERKKRGSQGR